jgi:hypothetical protein
MPATQVDEELMHFWYASCQAISAGDDYFPAKEYIERRRSFIYPPFVSFLLGLRYPSRRLHDSGPFTSGKNTSQTTPRCPMNDNAQPS